MLLQAEYPLPEQHQYVLGAKIYPLSWDLTLRSFPFQITPRQETIWKKCLSREQQDWPKSKAG
jgi:hypothetical protein